MVNRVGFVRLKGEVLFVVEGEAVILLFGWHGVQLREEIRGSDLDSLKLPMQIRKPYEDLAPDGGMVNGIRSPGIVKISER
jgi:hypothetical protein